MKNFNIPEVTEYGKNQLESLETLFTNAAADPLPSSRWARECCYHDKDAGGLLVRLSGDLSCA